MSKRNFTLLIIIVTIILAIILGFWYFQKPSSTENGGIGTNFFSSFNPFGRKTNPPPTTPPVDVSGYVPPTDINTETPKLKLVKVSSMPIAGFAIFQKERLKEITSTQILSAGGEQQITPSTTTQNTTTNTPKGKKIQVKPIIPLTEFVSALRYVDRATGNIYQAFADKLEERRFSLTVIPKVYEAYFGNNGDSVIMRYLRNDDITIATFFGSLPKELVGDVTTGDKEVKGSFLPDNITDMTTSPDTQKVFYLFNTGEIANGVVADLVGNKKIQVFDSPFTEWLTFWPNNKIITLTTKPASGVMGYMYEVNTDKKDFSRTLGGIAGLTTLTSPNTKLVLYGDDNLSLNIFNKETKASIPLGIKTMPEKCVWNKLSSYIYCSVPKVIYGALYPDSWYQGETSFDDQIWKIDAASGNATMIANPLDIVKEEIDGIKPALDESEDYLFFVNKKDSFLWELELK